MVVLFAVRAFPLYNVSINVRGAMTSVTNQSAEMTKATKNMFWCL